MKKIIYAFAASLTLAAFAGCTKDDAKNDEHNASFKLVMLDVTGETASVAVSSTGSEADTWYCFCSSDVNSPASALVSAEVAKLGGNVSSVLKSGNRQVDFSGLTPNTDYKAVVTGLLSDGTVYGTPVELKFRSGRAEGEIERNNDWQVSFQRGMVSQKNFTIADFVDVQDKSAGNEKFFTMILPAEQYPGDEKISAFLDECIAEVQKLVTAMGVTWKDVLKSGNISDKYDICQSGEWYAFVIGATESGRKSGLWNRTEKMTIPAITGSEDFMKYAGVWTYQYTSDKGSSNIDFELIPAISEEKDPATSVSTGFYVVRGWQGSDEQGPFFPDFTLVYQKEEAKDKPLLGDDLNGKLAFVSYDSEAKVAVDDKGTVGSLAMLCCKYDDKGQLANVSLGGFPAAIDVTGTTGTINGLEQDTTSGKFLVNTVAIGALVGNQVSLGVGAPMLPCNITKKEAASALAGKRFASVENYQPMVSYHSMAVNMSFAR